MQYIRIFPTFALAIILSSTSSVAAQRPERDPIAPQDATARANPAEVPTGVTPLAAGQCELTYERADNMWAASGRPDGNLGKETIRLEAGQKKVFSTDWKYEKMRNDGTNYYGSHARILTNSGGAVSVITTTGTISFGRNWWLIHHPLKADIQEVVCPVG